MKQVIRLAVKGCETLYDHQKRALLEKWSKEGFE
jgi:ribonuclease PH